MMTRDEHAKICTGHQTEIREDIKNLTDYLERRDDKAVESRHRLGDQIRTLSMEVGELRGEVKAIRK